MITLKEIFKRLFESSLDDFLDDNEEEMGSGKHSRGQGLPMPGEPSQDHIKKIGSSEPMQHQGKIEKEIRSFIDNLYWNELDIGISYTDDIARCKYFIDNDLVIIEVTGVEGNTNYIKPDLDTGSYDMIDPHDPGFPQNFYSKAKELNLT